jgi:hypothetical protein
MGCGCLPHQRSNAHPLTIEQMFSMMVAVTIPCAIQDWPCSAQAALAGPEPARSRGPRTESRARLHLRFVGCRGFPGSIFHRSLTTHDLVPCLSAIADPSSGSAGIVPLCFSGAPGRRLPRRSEGSEGERSSRHCAVCRRSCLPSCHSRLPRKKDRRRVLYPTAYPFSEYFPLPRRGKLSQPQVLQRRLGASGSAPPWANSVVAESFVGASQPSERLHAAPDLQNPSRALDTGEWHTYVLDSRPSSASAATALVPQGIEPHLNRARESVRCRTEGTRSDPCGGLQRSRAAWRTRQFRLEFQCPD